MKTMRSARCLGEAVRAHRPAPQSIRLLSSTSISRTLANSTSRPTSQTQRSPCIPQSQTTTRLATTAQPQKELSKTPLYDLHKTHGATMVPFGGFSMPVLYPSLSLAESHKHTRTHASLFDVSHMVQHRFTGPGAAAFLETITPIDTSALHAHRSTLSTLLWDNGGIVDDTIITKLENHVFYVVTNAGCRHKDLEYLKNERAKFEDAGGQAVHWEVLEGQGLVALQGPKSQEILESVLADPEGAELASLYFGQSRFMRIALPHHHHQVSSPLLVSRGGYTGEDGFEISIPEDQTTAVVEELISASKGALHLAGLGARDSLRLEAGMCLYGHDLDDTVTPVEGALSWIIPKSRRDPAAATFHGASTILSQLTPKAKGGKGVERRRIGLIVEGAPAREGAKIVDAEGKEIGKITSGCPSPTLGKNVAMGYVKDGLHKVGTEVGVLVRGKVRKATVSKMPFVPTKYYRDEEMKEAKA